MNKVRILKLDTNKKPQPHANQVGQEINRWLVEGKTWILVDFGGERRAFPWNQVGAL